MNTGGTNGAAALLEKMLGRNLLYFPCRHHIFELILKEVFLIKVLKSTTVGPNIPIFNRFKKFWSSIDQNNYKAGITHPYIQKHIDAE